MPIDLLVFYGMLRRKPPRSFLWEARMGLLFNQTAKLSVKDLPAELQPPESAPRVPQLTPPSPTAQSRRPVMTEVVLMVSIIMLAAVLLWLYLIDAK